MNEQMNERMNKSMNEKMNDFSLLDEVIIEDANLLIIQ